jgi:hypothetical protein
MKDLVPVPTVFDLLETTEKMKVNHTGCLIWDSFPSFVERQPNRIASQAVREIPLTNLKESIDGVGR